MASCACRALCAAAPTGLAVLEKLEQFVCAWSWHSQPPRFTFTVGAPINAAPISNGNEKCPPLRGIMLPQPVVMLNAVLFLSRPRNALPFTGVAPVIALALAE